MWFFDTRDGENVFFFLFSRSFAAVFYNVMVQWEPWCSDVWRKARPYTVYIIYTGRWSWSWNESMEAQRLSPSTRRQCSSQMRAMGMYALTPSFFHSTFSERSSLLPSPSLLLYPSPSLLPSPISFPCLLSLLGFPHFVFSIQHIHNTVWTYNNTVTYNGCF